MIGKTLTNPKGRFLIIGDLHGCVNEAMELLDLCQVTSDDTVIFAGDLVDRGTHNDKCVDLAMKHECVLGNHEERHVWYRMLEEQGKNANVTSPSHIETRKQLKDSHYEYFKQLPLYIRIPEHNAVVVHAGVFPGVPIESQSPHHLLHAQMLNPPNKTSKWPSKAPEGWKFWSTLWTGPEKVIFGHSVLNKPLVTEFAVGIDGGAVFGRSLWAYELPSGKVYEVKSRFDCSGTRSRSTTVFKVHGDVATFS